MKRGDQRESAWLQEVNMTRMGVTQWEGKAKNRIV